MLWVQVLREEERKEGVPLVSMCADISVPWLSESSTPAPVLGGSASVWCARGTSTPTKCSFDQHARMPCPINSAAHGPFGHGPCVKDSHEQNQATLFLLQFVGQHTRVGVLHQRTCCEKLPKFILLLMSDSILRGVELPHGSLMAYRVSLHTFRGQTFGQSMTIYAVSDWMMMHQGACCHLLKHLVSQVAPLHILLNQEGGVEHLPGRLCIPQGNVSRAAHSNVLHNVPGMQKHFKLSHCVLIPCWTWQVK